MIQKIRNIPNQIFEWMLRLIIGPILFVVVLMAIHAFGQQQQSSQPKKKADEEQ